MQDVPEMTPGDRRRTVMNRREMSAILAGASAEEVRAAAAGIRDRYEIQILKQPQKTLVMVKVRESVKKSLFYLGEVLATECMVTVNGAKGASVMAGDNFEKCINAAVIDGFMNTEKMPECGIPEEEREALRSEIKRLGEKQKKDREKLNRQIRKSKVNFNVMGE